MNIARTQVRNILLTLVVVCAFIVDARTARATTVTWPGCLPTAFDGAVAGIRDDLPWSRASCPGLSADDIALGRPTRA